MKWANAIRSAVILGLMSCLMSPVSWAGYDWVFQSGNCVAGGCDNNSASFGNEWTFDGANGHNDVAVSAWSNTGVGSGDDKELQTGKIKVWTGLGATNRSESTSSPDHAIDNGSEGRYDAVLFNFGSDSIALEKIKLGWYSGDSDITVLAYTGAGTPTLGGDRYSNLTSNGWDHVGDYSNLGYNENTINTGAITSSYWLIGAFNPMVSSETWSNHNDYFKIYALSGTVDIPPPPPTTSVPEPGSLLLVSLGLLPLFGRRMRA